MDVVRRGPVNRKGHGNLERGRRISGATKVASPGNRNLVDDVPQSGSRRRGVEGEHEPGHFSVRTDPASKPPPGPAVLFDQIDERLVLGEELSASSEAYRPPCSLVNNLAGGMLRILRDKAVDSKALDDSPSIELPSLACVAYFATRLRGIAVKNRKIERDRAFGVLRKDGKTPAHSGLGLLLGNTQLLLKATTIEIRPLLLPLAFHCGRLRTFRLKGFELICSRQSPTRSRLCDLKSLALNRRLDLNSGSCSRFNVQSCWYRNVLARDLQVDTGGSRSSCKDS